MSSLGPQFGPQLALFPDSKKGPTRRLEHAEMTPEQFKTLPGAWHHATYNHEMPTNSNGLSDPFQGGVHLGTRQAAVDRLTSLGPRDESLRARYTRHRNVSGYKEMPADAPGEIHVRRITPEAKFVNSPSKAIADQGGAWLGHPDLSSNQYYKNKHEGSRGELSIRIVDDSAITSHRSAIEKAVASGGRVHPLNRALLAQGGKHLDDTEKVTVTRDAQQKYLRKNPGAGY